ncbi:MAG: hypothetical protein M1819_001579 [Sarea resinae]|nr:MAG: hypothetical protein M1819_001579 [Sarea resinae]
MDPSSSSSKVTVEYFDPSGVLPVLSPGLSSRLPLRNLHWKSPSRPLRSIGSLHVDFVPHDQSEDSQSQPPALLRAQSLGADGRPPTADAGASRGGQSLGEQRPPTGSRAPSRVRERRHQIPGLRQTPYLKVYLLRCDDNESYKGTSRKLLRDWIKEHTTPPQGTGTVNAQESHDAFEWLIVHVVLPDTPAASQPRSTGSSGGSSGAEKLTSTSRWPGRGSTTILDKIRADFNGTSKSAKDRVAQIRIPKNEVPPEQLSRPSSSASVTPPVTESPQEQESAWADLIFKLKSLILTSFDQRVSQYEEDIREKDSQRSLPGWNFCTFFVLKEGLARGFESVGLVEDALLIYDELSVGLDSIVRDQATEISNGLGGPFLSYTEDLYRQIQHFLSVSKGSEGVTNEGEAMPSEDIYQTHVLDPTKKNYRDLILSNNISIFDFRCYLFARQKSLLLRLGNAWSPRSEFMTKVRTHPAAAQSEYTFHDEPHRETDTNAGDGSEDLNTLAEVCKRATDFITTVANIMRKDLRNSLYQAVSADSKQISERDSKRKAQINMIIENMVSSWIFSCSQQILDETSAKSLPVPPSPLTGMSLSSAKMTPLGSLKAAADSKSNLYPARRSSLPARSASEPHGLKTFPSAHRDARNGLPESRSGQLPKAGSDELAANRAELYVLGRGILIRLAKKSGWSVGWESLGDGYAEKGANFEEVNLEGTDTPVPEKSRDAVPTEYTHRGVLDKTLGAALSGRDDFFALYEVLTDMALRHYTVADRSKSIEQLLADMAVHKFSLGDYASAAAYFHRLASAYAESRWNLLETSMLKMYAKCLKHLHRKDEYVRVVLKLLAKAASREKREITRRGSLYKGAHQDNNMDDWLDDDAIDIEGYLEDITIHARELPYEISAPMEQYFAHINVSQYPQHYEDHDGFQLQLEFRHILRVTLEITSARVRLVSATGSQSQEIWLESEKETIAAPGLVKLLIGANVTTLGNYTVDKIVLQSHNLTFVYEAPSKSPSSTPINISGSTSAALVGLAKRTRILLYPRPSALEVRVTPSKTLHIDKQKPIEVEVSAGWNTVISAELRIRSASAGLRLRTADTFLLHDGGPRITDKLQAGLVSFGELRAGQTMRMTIPYDLENDLNELSFKIEVIYTTEKGRFVYLCNPTVSIILPLGVSVQDVFKSSALFSRFTISAGAIIPLQILETELKGSESYSVTCGLPVPSTSLVFPKQALSLVYKITRKQNTKHSTSPTALALAIDYSCLDEDALLSVENNFTMAVQDSPFIDLSRLLSTSLRSGFRERLVAHELEAFGLTGEIRLGAYEALRWEETLSGLQKDVRDGVREWLTNWHESNPSIPLYPPTSNPTATSSSTGSSALNTPITAPSSTRRITIPVEIPQIHVLHIADLHLISSHDPPDSQKPLVSTSTSISASPRGQPPSSKLATAGQMLPAELRIRHTRRWAPHPFLKNGTTERGDAAMPAAEDTGAQHAKDAPIDFTYEIHANPDVWLVGGRRRARFTAREGEMLLFPITLLPLRPGHHLLPSVEIRQHFHVAAPVPDSSGAGAGAEKGLPQSQSQSQAAVGLGISSPLSSPSPQSQVQNHQDNRLSPPAPHLQQQQQPNQQPLTCETHLASQADVVLVLPDLASTTVGLDPGGAGNTTWLVESKGRSVGVSDLGEVGADVGVGVGVGVE